MEFYISPQSGQFYMINVLENQWLSVTLRGTHSVLPTRIRSAYWLVWPPLTPEVVDLRPGRVIPKTIIGMVQTVSLHGTQCVRVRVWQCSPTV